MGLAFDVPGSPATESFHHADGLSVCRQREGDGTDRRRTLYALTEKGLDLLPLLFEMVLWSAKHDPRSKARRVPRLVALIRKDNRRLSRALRARVRRGEAIVKDYLRPGWRRPHHPDLRTGTQRAYLARCTE